METVQTTPLGGHKPQRAQAISQLGDDHVIQCFDVQFLRHAACGHPESAGEFRVGPAVCINQTTEIHERPKIADDLDSWPVQILIGSDRQGMVFAPMHRHTKLCTSRSDCRSKLIKESSPIDAH